MSFLGGRMRLTDVVMHGYRRAGLAVAAPALPGLLAASAVTAAASPVSVTAAASAATRVATAVTPAGKPVPVRPPSSPGARVGNSRPAGGKAGAGPAAAPARRRNRFFNPAQAAGASREPAAEHLDG